MKIALLLSFFIFFLIIVETYVSSSNEIHIPKDWREAIDRNHRLFSKSVSSKSQIPRSPLLIPSIGNGYLATVVGSDTVYIGGLFNGRNRNGVELTKASHRARIPAYLNLNITNAIIDYTETTENEKKIHAGGFAIDTKEGIHYERLFIGLFL